MAGFVQQLACCYVRHGYHHYVVGEIPPHKDPRAVDERMIERYELGVSKFVRARRKRAGLPNVQYIRFRRFFVLCATEPREGHRFYAEHAAAQIRHVREQPIAFAGYSIGWHRGADRRWHVSVRIHPERYRSLKAYVLELACRRSVEQVASEFAEMGFEPYAPVRRQLLSLLKAVNRERKVAGMKQLPVGCLRLRREVVRPFGSAEATVRKGDVADLPSSPVAS